MTLKTTVDVAAISDASLCSSSECDKCFGQGGREDPESIDQWHWCDKCDAATKHYERKRISSVAGEDWIKERWGGFTYLVIGRNEDFMLDFKNGSLFLHYENDSKDSPVGRVLLLDAPTRQGVIDAERLFGCGTG